MCENSKVTVLETNTAGNKGRHNIDSMVDNFLNIHFHKHLRGRSHYFYPHSEKEKEGIGSCNLSKAVKLVVKNS